MEKSSGNRPARHHPYRRENKQRVDENSENKLYVGNLDTKVTEYHVIKMFTPFGEIRREEFLWHMHGPKRGEPRGYAFVEFFTREDAEKAQAAMNGKTAFGRRLVVRFVEDKVVTYNQDVPMWVKGPKSDGATASGSAHASASAVTSLEANKRAKIAAIQAKLRSMEEEDVRRKKAGK